MADGVAASGDAAGGDTSVGDQWQQQAPAPPQALQDEFAGMVIPLRSRWNACMQCALLMQAHGTCVDGLS